ncbi:MAG: hypothetical protein ACTHM8_03915 [Sphingomonas sp.]
MIAGRILAAIAGLLALAGASPQAPVDRRYAACRAASEPAGQCRWQHGIYSAVSNDYFSSRLAVSGSADYAIHQAGAEQPDEFVPPITAAHLTGNSANGYQAAGEYLVCPLSETNRLLAERHLTYACIAGERDVQAAQP